MTMVQILMLLSAIPEGDSKGIVRTHGTYQYILDTMMDELLKSP